MDTYHVGDFQKLVPLDLGKCHTVSDIVEGMRFCSFGARMLGEVADTLCGWIKNGERSVFVYEGVLDTPLDILLDELINKGWFAGKERAEHYLKSSHGQNMVVVGRYLERDEPVFRDKRVIFINEFGMCRPGQVRDGYFPDVVFADPRLIMPILYKVLEERLEGKTCTVSELLAFLERSGFGGLADEFVGGAGALKDMDEDPDCTVFMTASGAMTVAKMGLSICDLIDMGFAQYFSTTGALVAHNFIEGVGLPHYKYDPRYDDAVLDWLDLNRITDTLEPETNFDMIELVTNFALNPIDARKTGPMGSFEFNRVIGEFLARYFPCERGILKSAYEKKIPLVVPAFYDSELANDLLVHNRYRSRLGRRRIVMDLERDTIRLLSKFIKARRVGIFSIGGGVPRNNTQNIAPMTDILIKRLGLRIIKQRYTSGCRICPDPIYIGHLSGCSFSENESWGKMKGTDSGRFAEVHTDATLILSFYVKYLMEQRAPLKLAA